MDPSAPESEFSRYHTPGIKRFENPAIFMDCSQLADLQRIHSLVSKFSSIMTEKRCIHPDVVDALRNSGVFRMSMPRAWGGDELNPLEQMRVIEALSEIDGSVGWCAMTGSAGGHYVSLLEDHVARSIYPGADAVVAGSLRPLGRARKVVGGWRVSGRWAMASGISHADLVVGGALIGDGSSAPTSGASELNWHCFFLPREDIEVIETRDAVGLEASGSHDYRVTDVFVPDINGFFPLGGPARPEPLYRLPWLHISTAAAAVLGIARHALGEAMRMCSSKPLTYIPSASRADLRDTVECQTAIAEAEAVLSAARCYLYDAVGQVWNAIQDGVLPSTRQKAGVRLAMAHAALAARRAVAAMHDQVGSSTALHSWPLTQALRDVHAASRHVVLHRMNLAPAGRVLLGLDPGAPMF
ncbi:acyl-CoA dehydrogenase family protein [Streptomyces sp. NPDC004787]|uniref:acyl-CoA dehydrogenase family protein n=1 Tax=Streptomyces sp. NPDC004787 TaxID=3154291 RepID=UPI0033AB7B1C